MKPKKTVYISPLILLFLSEIISCTNSGEHKNALPGSHHSETETEIDTSIWLKETRGIRDILEDKHGNIWFSSPDYVAKFDGKAIDYFSENDRLEITGNLHNDDNGTLWVENGFRAFRYDGKSFSEEKIDSIAGSGGLWIQRGLNPADTTFVEPGLYQVDQKNTLFHPLPINEDISHKFKHLPSTKAFPGKDSAIWIGTMEQVYGFKNGAFITIGRKEMGREDDARQMGIRGIFVDSEGVLWMADNGAGVFTYDGQEVVNFTKKHQLDEGDLEGNTLHRAFSIAESNDGKMWFGTVYSGVWSYHPETKEFRNYTLEDGIKSDNIWTIYKTSEGQLLFAGESPAAVYVFNGKKFDRKF